MPAGITDLPTPPSISDPTNFDTRMDALLNALPTFVTEANAYALYLAGAATPGAITIPYTFSTTTTDSDPGAGVVRLSNATQNASTVIRADLVDGVATTVTALLDAMDDSTSTTKGYLRLTKVGDGSKWLVFAVTAVATPSGYRNIAVSVVAGSASSPFTNGDMVLLTFTPNGDKGDTGAVPDLGPHLIVRDEKASGTGGGAASGGAWNQRTLNTVDLNSIPGASLGSNQITLPAGTYYIQARAPAYGVDGAVLRWYNVTDSAITLVGDLAVATAIAGTYFSEARLHLSNVFTIAGAKAFRLEQYCNSAKSDGLGYSPGSVPGVPETYSIVQIWKK
jgi:hypothetical protein